ncbi:MAG: DUF4423 domain-containing protein [Bryobacteraceae bacterium]
MRFRDRLEAEFAARRDKNARYSLRAFAAFLGTDHSTLSQILKGLRPVPVAQVRSWARKLGLSHEEASVFVAAEHTLAPPDAAREAQLRHWTAEAMAIVTEPVHWQIVDLSRRHDFVAETRWVAMQAGVSIDSANIAFSRLLRLGLIQSGASGKWTESTGLASLTQAAFRKLALERVREKAAEANIQFGKRNR